MDARFISALFIALAAVSSVTAAAEKQSIEFAELAHGKVQIIGRLGIPIGQVVRVDATVIAAETLGSDSSEFRGQYLFSIHNIAGREVSGVYIPFRVHRFAVSKLFPGRIELGGILQDMFSRKPSEAEINKAETELLSSGKRTFLVYEMITFFGVPAKLPADVALWSGAPFGPVSSVVVIKELETPKVERK